jgi:TRAP-type transport system periplasmic protein
MCDSSLLFRHLSRVFALALIAIVGPAAAQAETVTIRLGTILPSGTVQHQLLQSMAEQWRKVSDGTVKVVLYPDGRLGGESEMVKKMRIKQIGGSVLSAVGLSEIDPGVTGLMLMPMMFRSWAEVDYVRENMRSEIEQRLRAKGYEVLFWADAGWVQFFSKDPGASPDDLRKMKVFVWAGDPQQSAIMQSAGFRPVGLETTDIPLGLNTNLINMVPLPPVVALAGQIYGPAPHMLEINWTPIVGAAVVRADLWAKLPAALQKQLREIASATGAELRAEGRRESDESVRVMQQKGLKVRKLSPEETTTWRTLVESTYPQIRGSMVPADIFDKVQHLLADFRQTPAARP